MASEVPTEAPQPIPPPEQSVNERTAQAIVERCMGAVTSLDPQALDIELRRAALQFDHAKLITHIIEPFMSMIGQQWREGNLRIASEHLASVVVRSFIDSIRTTLQVPDDAPNLLVTTPLDKCTNWVPSLYRPWLRQRDGRRRIWAAIYRPLTSP